MKGEAIRRGKPYLEFEVPEDELEYDMSTIYQADNLTMNADLIMGKDVTFEEPQK